MHEVPFSTGNDGGVDREILVQHLLVSEDNLKLLMELQQKIAAGRSDEFCAYKLFL